jgi:hypothetical protein
VAKTRRKSTAGAKKGGARKKGARPAKRAVKRAGAKRKKVIAREQGVELRPIRERLRGAVKRLEAFQPTDPVRDAIARLNVCLAEINEICGPNMMIPPPPPPPPPPEE